ncbi:MAG: hypothetical protein V4496_06380 [Pseudomonadota bacterium]
MKQVLCLLTASIFFMLAACSSTTVPQIGAPVPCQIQSVEQVEQAVIAGLMDQHWEIISSSAHILEARKTTAQLQAMVHVAYGYRGFSIEYFDSKNMDYDVEDDTIDSVYEKWVYQLMGSINKILKQEVKQLPPVKCASLKDQYQQEE